MRISEENLRRIERHNYEILDAENTIKFKAWAKEMVTKFYENQLKRLEEHLDNELIVKMVTPVNSGEIGIRIQPSLRTEYVPTAVKIEAKAGYYKLHAPLDLSPDQIKEVDNYNLQSIAARQEVNRRFKEVVERLKTAGKEYKNLAQIEAEDNVISIPEYMLEDEARRKAKQKLRRNINKSSQDIGDSLESSKELAKEIQGVSETAIDLVNRRCLMFKLRNGGE